MLRSVSGVDADDVDEELVPLFGVAERFPRSVAKFFPPLEVGETYECTLAAYNACRVVTTSFVMFLLGIQHDLGAMMLSSDHVGVATGYGVWSSSQSFRSFVGRASALFGESGEGMESAGGPFQTHLSDFCDWSVLLYEDLCLYVSLLAAQSKLYSAIYNGEISGCAVFGSPVDPDPNRRPLLQGVSCTPRNVSSELTRLEALRSDLASSSVFPPVHPIFRAAGRCEEYLRGILKSSCVEEELPAGGIDGEEGILPDWLRDSVLSSGSLGPVSVDSTATGSEDSEKENRPPSLSPVSPLSVPEPLEIDEDEGGDVLW